MGVGTVYMYMASNGTDRMGRSGGWAQYTITCTWLAMEQREWVGVGGGHCIHVHG